MYEKKGGQMINNIVHTITTHTHTNITELNSLDFIYIKIYLKLYGFYLCFISS
jgi:hypothetical protein